MEEQLDIEYSQIYWLHNNSVVPTTTQRTTSTSTQSVHKSIFSTSMSSNAIERITEKGQMNDKEEEEADTSHASAATLTTASCLVILSLLKAMF